MPNIMQLLAYNLHCTADQTAKFSSKGGMEKLHVLIVYLSFLTRYSVLEPANLFPSEQDSSPDVFPACVELDAVWPPPHSILKPFHSQASLLHYAFRVRFSKPVGIEDMDTTGGYQPELMNGNLDQLKDGNLFSVDNYAPVFLSPSPTNFTRYYPHRIRNWYGSDCTFMVYFAMSGKTARLEMVDKVYLVIDGGRFFSYESVGSELQRTYVQTTILGEYYFEEYLQMHPQYQTKPPLPIVPSIYCQPLTKRPYFTTSDTQGAVESGGASLGNLTIELPTEGHQIELSTSAILSDPETFTGKTTPMLLLSLTTRGWGGKVTIALPPIIKATFKDTNVTVRLQQSSVSIRQPISVPQLTVPVTRSLVYDLRERIYHNEEKVMTRRDAPVFAHSPLSREPADRRLFPQSEIHGRDQLVNMEVVDPVLNVKLRQYYSRSQYTGDATLPLPKLHWNEVTRSAPISAKPDSIRYSAVPDAFSKLKDLNRHKFLRDNHKACSSDSKRNPGHSGSLIDHVIELGSMYHMLEPMDFSTWSLEETATEAELLTKDGGRKPLTVTSEKDLSANSFPALIRKALERYVCLLPPTMDVPRPARGQNERWVHLDECIFVPREVAESEDCGGLMLFKNIANIVNNPNFCNNQFGDCIGLPIQSTKRFPVIPTYGLHELTGWVASTQSLADFQSHPVGSLLMKKPHCALPRALLKYTKAHDSPESSTDRITLQLLPVMGPSSVMKYTVELTEGFEILRPGIGAPGDEFCDSVWQMGVEQALQGGSLDGTLSRDAVLTATVLNVGQGGGEFIFDVRCSGQIIVNPTSGLITKWINPGVQSGVEFILNGELASSSSRKLHKCELRVSVRTQPDFHGREQQSQFCIKFLESYYGAFTDPCTSDVGLPHVDLAYYVLPESELASLVFMESLNNSVGSSRLRLIRVITLSLDISRGEEILAQSLSELSVECGSANILTLAEEQLSYEGMLSIENPDHVIPKKPLVYHSHFTKHRKVIFLAKSEWDESEEPSDCSIELRVSRPNWLCAEREEVLKKLYIPLTKLDTEAVERIKSGPFAFLVPLYGQQSNGVMLSLILCLMTTIILIATTALTHGILYIYRNELPKKGTLQALKEDLQKAERADAEYWDNPQVYLVPGDEHVEAHFILHNFKATEPLNTPQLKNLKIAGTLKYMNKELQVMFGHIKKVYVDKSGESDDIWLQASSGMYLLQFENISPDYKDKLIEFLNEYGINPERQVEPTINTLEEERKSL